MSTVPSLGIARSPMGNLVMGRFAFAIGARCTSILTCERALKRIDGAKSAASGDPFLCPLRAP